MPFRLQVMMRNTIEKIEPGAFAIPRDRNDASVRANGREPRIVKFRSGRYDTMWKGNVVGIGNASGFV